MIVTFLQQRKIMRLMPLYFGLVTVNKNMQFILILLFLQKKNIIVEDYLKDKGLPLRGTPFENCLQGGPQKCPNFSLLITFTKIRTPSRFFSTDSGSL